MLRNERAEEVLLRVLVALSRQLLGGFGGLADVVPQRNPVLLLVPHVGTLEDRNHVAVILVEDRPEQLVSGSHALIISSATDRSIAEPVRRPECPYRA
jgi:hypothetical protein